MFKEIKRVANLRVRNGIFPAISVNHDVTISNCSPPMWASETRGNSRRRRIPEIWQPSSCNHFLRELKGAQDVKKHRILAPDSWDTRERNGFSEPRLLHLPIHRNVLNSLAWDVWFSVSHKNTLMFRLPALCCKLQYNLIPPLCPLRAVLSGLFEMAVSHVKVLKIPTE